MHVSAWVNVSVRSLSCVARTIQLVNEGLLSQRAVSDAVASGRQIVGHFKCSPLAQPRLQDIIWRWTCNGTAAAGRWNRDEQHPPHDREVAGASTAEVPRINFQKYILFVEAQADNGIKTMRKTLLKAVHKHFSAVEDELPGCWTQNMKTGETVKLLRYRYNVGSIVKYFNIFIILVISFFVRNIIWI